MGVREMTQQKAGEDATNVSLPRGRNVVVDSMSFKLVKEV
jgi:hypothetical protein